MSVETKLLNNAKELIRKGWTQAAFARNENGTKLEAEDPSATSWCAMGALRCAMFKLPKDEIQQLVDEKKLFKLNDALKAAVNNRPRERWMRLDTWNDSIAKSAEDVIDLYERAEQILHERAEHKYRHAKAIRDFEEIPI